MRKCFHILSQWIVFGNGLAPEKKVIFILFLQSDGEDFNYIVAFFLGTAACLYQVGSLRF